MSSISKRIGIFSEVRFINESLAEIGVYAIITALAASIALINAHKQSKEKDKEKYKNLQKVKEECEKRRKSNELFIQDCSKHYGINNLVPKIESGHFKDTKSLYNSMEMDCKGWVLKISNSKIFKSYVNELLNNPDAMESIMIEYDGGKRPESSYTLSYFKSILKVDEGINGYSDSMQIIDGSQSENIEFGWIVNDIARMLEIKYEHYVGRVGTGDGDEGTVYYEI